MARRLRPPIRVRMLPDQGGSRVAVGAKTWLVSTAKAPMVALMAITFFRRLFGPVSVTEPGATAGEVADETVEAQFALGLKYARGLGEAQDFTAAARCYREAAEKSYPPAQFNLGMLYSGGQGVPKDEGQAMLWIGKAAQQGNAEAQYNLGMRLYRAVVCSRAKDLPESRIEAYKWLRLAAAQDFPDSEAVCNRITFSMSRSEVADGNQRAAAFLAGRAATSLIA